jgi:hypothetical protein
MRRAPGEWIAVALLAVGLGSSAVLCRLGHAPVSSCIRGKRLLRVTAVMLAAHVAFTLPWDPLRAIGRRLSPAVVPPPPMWSGGGGVLP